MGKNKKKKKSNYSHTGDGIELSKVPNESSKTAAKRQKRDTNPLLTSQKKFLKSIEPQLQSHFFSPKHVTPEQRAKIWEDQADLGETLVNSYAWATPDPRLLKVFQRFGPIVEVGCGANAYWSKWMNAEGGVDVVAFDASLDVGGKISGTEKSNISVSVNTGGLVIRQGSPKTLFEDTEVRDSNRTLFLCYPDEEDNQQDGDDEKDERPVSMAAACLEHFTGTTVIHVGELYGDTLSLEQAPFGRSSSNEFQQRLASEYHCILKMRLENNWLHVRDTLSVWKRTETCCMAFQNENDEEDEEDEVHYKYIPPEEMLPADLAAPCVAQLLNIGSTREKDAKSEINDKSDFLPPETAQVDIDTKRSKSSDCGENNRKKTETKVIAGNAW